MKWKNKEILVGAQVQLRDPTGGVFWWYVTKVDEAEECVQVFRPHAPRFNVNSESGQTEKGRRYNFEMTVDSNQILDVIESRKSG